MESLIQTEATVEIEIPSELYARLVDRARMFDVSLKQYLYWLTIHPGDLPPLPASRKASSR